MLLPSLIEASMSFGSNHGEEDVLLGWVPPTGKSWRRNNEASKSGLEISAVGDKCEASRPYQTRKRRRLHQSSVEKLSRGSGGVDSSVLNLRNGDSVPLSQVEGPMKTPKILKRSDRVSRNGSVEFGSTHNRRRLPQDSLINVSAVSRHVNNSSVVLKGSEISDSEVCRSGMEPLIVGNKCEASIPYPTRGSRRTPEIYPLSKEPRIDNVRKSGVKKNCLEPRKGSENDDGGGVLPFDLEETVGRGYDGIDDSVFNSQHGNHVPYLPVECHTKLERSSKYDNELSQIGLEPLASGIRHEPSKPYPTHSARRIKKNSIVILPEEPTKIDEVSVCRAEKDCSKTGELSEIDFHGQVQDLGIEEAFKSRAEKNCSQGFGGRVMEPRIHEVSTSRIKKDCTKKTYKGSETNYSGKALSVISKQKADGNDDGLDDCIPKSQQCGHDVPCLPVECPTNYEQDFDSFCSLQSQNKVDLVGDSFDMLGLKGLDGKIPIKELCISLHRSWGLMERNWPLSSADISELSGTFNGRGEMQPCKICGQLENTTNMLICDHCDEAFHVYCTNPKKKSLPTDEWFCTHCLGKKYHASTETYFLRSRGSVTWQNAAAKSEIGPIAFILRYPDGHKSSVRIGEEYQAEVPEWSKQNSNDADGIGEPVEMNPADTLSSHDNRHKKFSSAGSYSNWIQCREVLNDDSRGFAKGTICGKWRRAPFYVVQTNDWDCSCAVTWDPIHSDCAVPQELGTEEVLVHLKYIEKMRSRLASKRR